MPDTLDVPEWATEREEETIKRLNRNRRIRRSGAERNEVVPLVQAESVWSAVGSSKSR